VINLYKTDKIGFYTNKIEETENDITKLNNIFDKYKEK
jgi:hypothetical protein